MIRNPFRDKTKEEIALKEAEDKAITSRLKNISECAKHILSSQDAIKYRRELEFVTRDMIRVMRVHADSDPVKDAYFLRTLINKLDYHYNLLESIEGDVK